MKHQRRTIWSLAVVAGLCCSGQQALGQIEAPQYPQYVQYPQGAPPVTPAVPAAQVTLTADQIDQLVGPIALYPDPLLSLIFPASTYVQDVIAAENWLAADATPTEADIDAQPWDASIKGLVHYPTVLKMMADQPDWTEALGAAFLNQQPDVLASVQRLRAQARADHNLQTNQQEQVVENGGSILIEPVDPDVIYVPQYDPNLVYEGACPISYGVGFPIGLWCDNDFDWNGGYVQVGGGWYQGWHHPAAWDQHPPKWDRRPSGWVAAPKRWARNSSRPAPRLESSAVSRLGLDRPRGTAVARPGSGEVRKSGAPLSTGREPAAASPRNAFDSTASRQDVQHEVQRARPAAAQPAVPARREEPAVQPRPAPRAAEAAPARTETRSEPQAAPRAAEAAPARTETRSESQSAPSSAFSGGSGGESRAESDRGHASSHR